jgi:hypothetical protein
MKKGQFQLSFGMIFSIIIIIAIVVVAFYVISYFLNLGRCAQIGAFYDDLNGEVNKAWAQDFVQETYRGSLPSKVRKVCFGAINQTFDGFEEEHSDLIRPYRRSKNNVFVYPNSAACDRQSGAYYLEHAQSDRFFCVQVREGEARVRLTKDVFEALVNLEAP